MGDPRHRFLSDLEPLDEPGHKDDEDAPRHRFISELEPLEEHQAHAAPQAPEASPDRQAPEVPWYESLIGGAASAADGVLLHHGGEVGRGMAHAANALGADIDPNAAEAAIDQAAREHPTANRLGGLTTGVLGGAAAGPGMLAQGAMAAGQGAASEYGQSHDIGRAGFQGTASGVLGAGGAAIGGMAGRAIGGSSSPALKAGLPGGGSLEKPIASAAPDMGILGELLSRGAGYAAHGLTGSRLAGMAARGGVRQALGGAAGKVRSVSPMGDAMSQMGGATGGQLGQDLAQGAMTPIEGRLAEQAGATAPKSSSSSGTKAYATPSTMDWALKKIMSGPISGLSTDDVNELNHAVMSGDSKQAAALSYQLRQRSPAFAQQYEKTLRSLNGETQ